ELALELGRLPGAVDDDHVVVLLSAPPRLLEAEGDPDPGFEVAVAEGDPGAEDHRQDREEEREGEGAAEPSAPQRAGDEGQGGGSQGFEARHGGGSLSRSSTN